MSEIKKTFRPIKYSLAQIEQAKQLYMGFNNLSRISRETDIPRSTLRYYVGQSWKGEREIASTELIADVVGARKHFLVDISHLTLDTIFNSIRTIQESDKPMGTKDMLNMAKTLEILDKLAAVDKKNNPTGLERDFGNGDNTIDMEEVEDLNPFSHKDVTPKEDAK